MARAGFQYRASEPSQMETQLALLATKPETAGAAMQLLPGAAAIRQDVGATAGAAFEREQLLAEMTQRETGRHQLAGDTTAALGLKEPGALALARGAPGTGYLFGADSDPLINAMTSEQFRAQGASTQDKLADSYYKGVQSGYRTPTDVASGQMGYGLDIQAPEAEKIAGMHIAAAGARAAAEREKPATPSLDKDSNLIYSGLRPEQIEGARQAQLLANSPEGRGSIAIGPNGPVYVPPKYPIPLPQASVVNKQNVTVRQKPGGSLGTGGTTTTSAAPSGGASPPIAGGGGGSGGVATPGDVTGGEAVTPASRPMRDGPKVLLEWAHRRAAQTGQPVETFTRMIQNKQIQLGVGNNSKSAYIIEGGKVVKRLNFEN